VKTSPAILDLLRALAPEGRFAWDGLYCVELRQGSNFDTSLRLGSLPRSVFSEAVQRWLVQARTGDDRRFSLTPDGFAALSEQRIAA